MCRETSLSEVLRVCSLLLGEGGEGKDWSGGGWRRRGSPEPG